MNLIGEAFFDIERSGSGFIVETHNATVFGARDTIQRPGVAR